MASTPPAMALARNITTTAPGPTTVPSAPISFTSPAPVPPAMWPGSIRPRPSAPPATDASGDVPVTAATASVSPVAAVAAVSAFGIRPVRRSMPAPAIAAAAEAAKERSDIGSRDDLPQGLVDHVADGGHRAEGDQGDERAEHCVLDQILPVVSAEPPVYAGEQVPHGECSSVIGVAAAGPAPPGAGGAFPTGCAWARWRRRSA